MRRWGQGVEEARQEVPDLENAAEGERRGKKRRGLGIARVGIAVGKRHRVGGELRSPALLEKAGKGDPNRGWRVQVLPFNNTLTQT